jgi:ATP-dependent protease ClpP protease subunit
MEDTNRKLWHRKAEDDDLNDPFSPPLPFAISFVKEETQTCIVELGNYVEHEFVYSRLLSQLRDLPTNCDRVELRLANFGGSCHKGIELFNAFKECLVPVDVVVVSPSYSCGAILALCGRSLTLKPGAFLMYHNYSSDEVGKGGELVQAVTQWDESFHVWLSTILHPFLTTKELQKLKVDGDVYVKWYDADLATRIKRHFDTNDKGNPKK